MYAPDSRWGRTIIFWQGGGGNWNIFKCKHFFKCRPCYKQFFCFSVFLQTLFFHLHTIYFSVHSFCKQFISKFPPPPRSVKKLIQIVRPLEAREKEDHVVRGFMSLTQLLCVLCGRLHISTTANLATQKVPVVDRWPLWRGSWEGLGGRRV